MPKLPPSEEIDLDRRFILNEQILMLDKELEVYAHPSWDAFVRRLEELEHKALAELIEGTGDPASARAKVKLLRHLVGIPDWVRDERARIETELEEA